MPSLPCYFAPMNAETNIVIETLRTSPARSYWVTTARQMLSYAPRGEATIMLSAAMSLNADARLAAVQWQVVAATVLGGIVTPERFECN